jgi:integrase
MKMRTQTNLVKRGNMFYYRARVPADLVPVLKRTERWLSLQTRDEAEAKRRIRAKQVELDHEYETLRARRAAHAPLSPEAAERLGLLFVEQELRDDEEWRRNGTTRANLDAWEDIATDDLADWREAVATGRLDRAQTRQFNEWVEELTKAGHVGALADTDRRLMQYEFVKANVRALELRLGRNKGTVAPIPRTTPETPLRVPQVQLAPTSQHNGTSSLLLSEAFERWNAERQLSDRTKADWDRALRLFVGLHGDIPLTQVTKAHLVAIKDSMVAKGRAANTVEKMIGAHSTVFRWCVDNGLLAVNVAHGIRVARGKVEREKRLPFTADQLTALFASSIYSAGARPVRGRGEAAYWLPLLAMWTGARLEELGQLTLGDIRQEAGHWVIVISDRGEGRVKTASSRRRVPIAWALVDLGFLRYVEDLRGRKLTGSWLFPDLVPSAVGVRTQKWSDWFGEYLRETVGIQDKRVVFHSFRHSYKAACRAAGISEEVHDQLTGHAAGSVGRSYGSGLDYPLGPLVDAIGRLRFSGVTLPAPWSPTAS